jgi:hypothetical protein
VVDVKQKILIGLPIAGYSGLKFAKFTILAHANAAPQYLHGANENGSRRPQSDAIAIAV